jgi:hypothetical protein
VVAGVSARARRLARSALVLDLRTRRWSVVPGPTPREHLGVTALAGVVYAVGGSHRRARHQPPPLRELPPRGSLVEAAPARAGRSWRHPAPPALAGQIVSVGGEEPGGTIAEVMVYRVEERRWVRDDDLPTPRHGVGVAALRGRVFVIGGGPEPGLTVSSANGGSVRVLVALRAREAQADSRVRRDGVFRGWARQPGLRTVEGAIREALDAVFPRWDGLAVPAATDTGVHGDRTGRQRATSRGGPRPSGPQRTLSTRRCPNDVAVVVPTRRPPSSNARFFGRVRGSYRYRDPYRPTLAARGAPRPALGRARSRSPTFVRPLRSSSGSTTSVPSRRPRRGTRSSCERVAADWERSGGSARASRSRQTASSATWCARSSARCSRRGRRRPIESGSYSRVVPAPRPDSPRRRGGLYLERVQY